MTYLLRFLDAQKDYYYIALREMREGVKRTHWIWFIFPQMKGLGHSPEAQLYGMTSFDEAKAYLEQSPFPRHRFSQPAGPQAL